MTNRLQCGKIKTMIKTKDHKTGQLLDPWRHLGPKRRKLLDRSWAGLFREHILEELPVGELARHYHDDFGRPTKELYTVMGTVLLQQMHDLTDEDTVEELSFDEQWHYALDITDESDESKYMSLKTLWTARNIFAKGDIGSAVFNCVGAKLSQVFNVNASKQRVDSVHIKSNMRRLGRIGILSKTINKFLVNLKRRRQESFDRVPEATVERYFTKDALGCFSRVKPSESAKTLERLSCDAYELIELFSHDKEICRMNGYKLLARVFDDHCEVIEGEDDEEPSVVVKPPKEVPSDSVQNPSDPDAGYDGHKGQGYQVQVMETYCAHIGRTYGVSFCDDPDPKVKERTLNLITHVEVESAAEHDSHALLPAIESVDERGIRPEEVLADSLYGGDENIEAAKSKGVEVVSPVMGAQSKGELGLEDFEFSEHGIVINCPAGHSPEKADKKRKKKNVGFTMAFAVALCSACEHIEDCPIKPGKKHYYLRYDKKALRLALRRKYERTDGFNERYRYRAGVEATMSEYDRLTGVKHLRVRRMRSVSLFATLKAVGVNIFRATAVRNARIAVKMSGNALKSLIFGTTFAPKMLYESIRMNLRIFFNEVAEIHSMGQKTAA